MNVLFSLLLVLLPLKMETGSFTIYQDGKKIGTEDFTITPRSGSYVVDGHTIIADSGQNADLLSHMELDADLKPTLYQFTSAVGSIRLKIENPISQFEYSFQGDKQTDDVRFPDDGVIIDSNFFHHYAILLYRVAGKSGKTTVSGFAPQELHMGPIEIRSTGNSTYELDSGNLKVIATTDKDGKLIRLTVPEAKVVVERG
jgi:hypothetical protein